MQSPINFSREVGRNITMDALLRMLDTFAIWVQRNLTGTVTSVTVNVSSGSGEGSSGTSVTTEYRSGTFSGSSGTVSVLFSSAMSSGGYRAYVFVRGTHDAVPMDENKLTKGASGFTFASTNSITGWYFCIIDS